MDELKKTSPHVILKILVEIWNIFSSFFYLLYLKATVLTSVAAIKKLESQHFRFLKYFLQFHVLRLHVKFCHTRSDFHCKQLLQFEGSETCQHINHRHACSIFHKISFWSVISFDFILLHLPTVLSVITVLAFKLLIFYHIFIQWKKHMS